ncbi:MAG: energy transducer TonB [Undibacterium sp.]|uniref:energy transducer TonB n=1 Tax=Undibacterium sp. TaxID=1914977 RepID=UPI00271565CF|nr:energy transducer TonB [Undibacterium sp.]MDO8653279.1 energy transducer TonB [Undibacterium sp.]
MDFSGREAEPGKKFVGIGLVILFHAVLVYALINGLAREIIQAVQKPLETKIVEEVKPPPPPPDTPPPPPPKLLAPPPPFVPPPEVQVQQQVVPANAIAAVSNVKPESNAKPTSVQQPVAEAKPVGPSTVPGVIDFKQAGCKPEYPRASLRNEETGTVGLSVLIGADGSIAEVKIDKSSGFRGLDNAVKAQLMSGTCKNKPGTVDGKPQPTWTKVNYVWSLE